MGSGGPWTQADVNHPGTRPGFYINFIEAASSQVGPGDRGIVGIISEADWGPHNEVIEFGSIQEVESSYTALEDATSRLFNLARLAFLGGARTVKLARVMNTTNAVRASQAFVDTDALPANVIRIEAKYYGVYGNLISVDISDDPVDSTKTRLRIYVDNDLAHTITSTVNHGSAGFIDNVVALLTGLNSPWITATKVADGNNDLADVVVASPLLLGANGDPVTSSEFTDCLDLFSANKIHILSTDSTNGSIRTLLETWVDDRRADGYKVMLVVGSATGEAATTMITNAQALNNGAVVYVGPGVVMPNSVGVSTGYNGATVASLVAGLIAGVASNRSITYAVIPTATNVELSLTNNQVKSMLAGGVLAITATPPGVSPAAHVEKGITTLYNPGVDDIASFKHIRTVRTVDGIAEGLAQAAQSGIIGSIVNDDAGKAAVLDAVKDFLNNQVEARTIHNDFTVAFDPSKDNEHSAIFLLIGLRPVDAIEYIYTTVELG